MADSGDAHDDLTDAERAMIAQIARGRRARMEGASVRARVIRDLATEINEDWSVRPVGVRIYDAKIVGTLDLEGCTVAKPLLFFFCTFGTPGDEREPLQFRDARLRRLGLYECQIHGGIKADRLQVESAIFMRGSRVHGRTRFRGAEIGGSLTMEDAQFTDDGTALVLDGAEIGGPWLMRCAKVMGEVRFTGAHIRGGLLVEAAQFVAQETAIVGDGAVIDGPWVLRRAKIEGRMQVRGLTVKGLVGDDANLRAKDPALVADGARIDGELSLRNAKIDGGVAISNASIAGRLNAEAAQIKARQHAFTAGGLNVRYGVRMIDTVLEGTLRIDGAEIGKAFAAAGLTIKAGRTALTADVIRIGGNWDLRRARITGGTSFPGATVDGQLVLTDSVIAGANEAVRADGFRIRGGFFMSRARLTGIVRFPSSDIGNQVRFQETSIQVARGPAIFASGTRMRRDFILSDGFRSSGGIVLDHATINGTLTVSGSKIASAACARGRTENPAERGDRQDLGHFDKHAISLVDARLDRLQMPAREDDRPIGIVDLSRAVVGSFEDYAAAWPPARRHTKSPDLADHFVLDGFVYEHLENPAGSRETKKSARRVSDMRISWLGAQSGADLDQHFKPQAWMQLAGRLRAQGYHDDAQRISIARRRRYRASVGVHWSERLQSWLLDTLALFGFSPWRTVAWMVFFVLAFAGIWFAAAQNCQRAGCAGETVFVRSEYGRFSPNKAEFERAYPAFNPLAYSFDLFVPLISFGYQDYWRPRLAYGPIKTFAVPWVGGGERGRARSSKLQVTITWGAIFYLLYVVEMIVGLILTSIAVTAFTGLLRRGE